MTAPAPPLLSIAVPTRNRQTYLLVLVDDLLRSPRRDFEIVVQDNSDDDSLRADLQSRLDDRLRYNFCAERLSVVQNCDDAVRACTGRYVCMLGDDDGLLLDESLELLQRCLSENIDAVVPGAYYYTWPSLTHKTWGNVGGRLYEARFSGRCEPLDANRERDLALARGGAFGLFQMPRVYQAFVAAGPLQKLREMAGTCFPGPSPDMANAVALTKVVNRCWHIDFPYIIMGHSKGSGGGMGAEKKHRGDIANQTHLPTNTAALWNPAIPFFWSGPTIYAQSAHCALRALWIPPVPRINLSCLYASCLIYERWFWQETLAAMRHSGDWMPWLYVRALGQALVITARRARSFFNNVVRHSGKVPEVQTADIAQAMALARKRINSAGLRALWP